MTTVLHFSGGADSLATLFVVRPRWDDLTVMWLDTGAAYPETHELMEKISRLVPHFQAVRSDKPGWEPMNGIAVDVVPERYTRLGHLIHGTQPQPLYTSWAQCCAVNIWAPMERATLALGATVVIRGQRTSEHRKTPIRTGHVDVNGIRYEFPIEDWSRERVLNYCQATCPDLLPEYYAAGERTSHDCWDCIAFLDDNRERIANLPHERREKVGARLRDYRAALRIDMEVLNGIHI